MVLGRVAGGFGVAGRVRIRPYTERPEGLLAYPQWLLGGGHPAWQPVSVTRGQVHGEHLIVEIEGITTREQATSLKGREIAVWRDALPVEADDEVYLVDLIGLEVQLQDGRGIGRIDGFIDVGGTQVMRVVAAIPPNRLTGGTKPGEWLIPFREPHVVEVDLEVGVVRVEWPDAAADGR